MNFVSKFWSNPGTIALLRLLVFRFLFFWFRFGFVFVLLSVDWNILLMSRFGHAQFSQPIRVLPDTMDQSEYLMSKPITIENPRSAKLFKFKPETLICVTRNSKNSCSMTVDHDSFELSIDLLPVKTLTSGCTKMLELWLKSTRKIMVLWWFILWPNHKTYLTIRTHKNYRKIP